MLRVNWFMVVVVVTNCQLFGLAANTEQSDVDTQQILIRSKLIEINRTKLRQLGVDLAGELGGRAVAATNLSKSNKTDIVFQLDAIKENPIASISFVGLLDAMCQNKVARILSEPKITTVAGRKAEISNGSTIKIDLPLNGEVASADIFVGTKLKVEPQLIANNKIRIDYCINYSKLSEQNLSEQSSTPRVARASVDTTFEVRPGETFVSGGLLKKVRNGNKSELYEVVLLVTPELVDKVVPSK